MLRLATITALFAAWIATAASAQSADEGYYYKLSTADGTMRRSMVLLR